MAFTSANTKIQRKLSIQNSSKATRGGFQTFDPAAPGATDGADGAILIDQSIAGNYYTLRRGATAGSAASYQHGIYRYCTVIEIVGGTTGTATLPSSLSGIDLTTNPVLTSLATTDGAAQSTVLITVSGTTLTATLGTTTGGGKHMYVTVAIP